MPDNIKETLKTTTKDILSEDALGEIEEQFNAAVEKRAALQVEAALSVQDEDHADKVQKLLEAIDEDHSKKLERIVEAINENHHRKLQAVIKKLSGDVDGDALNFKNTLVENISNYLELYLEEVMPEDTLKESVTNKKALYMLGELRNMLGVDMAMSKATIKNAIADGKNQIDTANQLNESLTKENDELKEKLKNTKSSVTLETMAKELPSKKQKYLQKVLGGKSEQFIKENFQYTLDLYDKEVERQTAEIKAEAEQMVKGNIDAPVEETAEPLNESVNSSNDTDSDDPLFNTYMGELGKY